MANINMTNPLMCEATSGICEVPENRTASHSIPAKKPVTLVYFTDPICSSCWGIEPQLRKLKLEYGDDIDIEYRMGGLLKEWNAYGGTDVRGPKDVALHWDEASVYYNMPIDGDVWLEDPLHSSYPPSIAFKAAQLQGEEKAVAFLRRTREMLFLEKKNITKWEHLCKAAIEVGLDVEQFRSDYEGRAEDMFNEDLAYARQLGVRGFPTIFFLDEEGNRFLVYGSKPYESYEQALLRLYPSANKKNYDKNIMSLFAKYPTMAVKEFAVLSNQTKEDATVQLEVHLNQGMLSKIETKNGVLYRMQH